MTPVNPSGVPVWGNGFFAPVPSCDRTTADQLREAFKALGQDLTGKLRDKQGERSS